MKKLLLILILAALVAVSIKVLPGFIATHQVPVVQYQSNEVNLLPVNPNPIKNMFGVNCYEWNFESNPFDPNDPSHVYAPKMEVIKNFTAIRH